MRVANKNLSTFFLYAYSTAAWLGIQSLVLILTPKVLISLLAQESRHASDLELYFSRSLGFALSILALIMLFFTGAIPVSSSVAEPISLEDNDPKAPYAQPILLITFLFHLTSTIYCWVQYTNYRQSGYILGSIGYGGLACLAGFLLMFGSTTRVSSRTGQDKRTAGFPFANTSAYDRKDDRKLR